jgi:hypothetical protein
MHLRRRRLDFHILHWASVPGFPEPSRIVLSKCTRIDVLGFETDIIKITIFSPAGHSKLRTKTTTRQHYARHAIVQRGHKGHPLNGIILIKPSIHKQCK